MGAAHGTRFWTSKVNPIFMETVQDLGQNISYRGVISHHHNIIVESSITKFNLENHNILLNYTSLWPEDIITIM